MNRESAVRRRWIGRVVLPLVPLVLVTGCGAFEKTRDADARRPTESVGRVVVDVPEDGPVQPGMPVTVAARDARLYAVSLAGPDGTLVPGGNAPDGASWTNSVPLAYGTKYTLNASAVDAYGYTATATETFTTISPEDELRVEVLPEAGSTVGIGMPVTVAFDRPVTDPTVRAAVEKRLSIASSTPVEGAWGWVDAKTVRFRPRNFWPAGTRVSIRPSLLGIDFGEGLYGADAAPIGFQVGDAVVATVDSNAHRMTLTRNGRTVRTVPVTTGKPGFTTRAGTKVVLGKESHVLMDGTTVGIAAGSSEGYRLDVYWATRVTWSGEFVHAAPWSVRSQGNANVSHGCVGLSTENARWFYDQVKLGDVVTVVNTGNPKSMEPLGNGYGEWNLTWNDWLEHGGSGAVTTAAL